MIPIPCYLSDDKLSRNEKIFDGTTPNPVSVIERASQAVSAYWNACFPPSTNEAPMAPKPTDHWLPPPTIISRTYSNQHPVNFSVSFLEMDLTIGASFTEEKIKIGPNQ
ncbi:hypothetical protein K1719_031714 [Acacia pycnantha]|nr:hypothetical protein K1719_031714 [Acacia pycnantha]